MSDAVPGQPTNPLAFLDQLQSYLKTEMEVGEPRMVPGKLCGLGVPECEAVKVKVTITNTAASTLGGHKVVFMGVGLSAASIGETDAPPKWLTREKRDPERQSDGTFWWDDDKVKRLLDPVYSRLDAGGFPEVTSGEQGYGEALFPGQSVVYTFEIPSRLAPYLRFRVDGTVSRRHLLHQERMLVMQDSYTRPPLLDALRSFNAIDIYGPFGRVMKAMPVFGSDARLAEVKAFSNSLPGVINEIAAVQTVLNDAFHKYPMPEFRAHIRRAFIFLDDVRNGVKRMQGAVASMDAVSLEAAASSIRGLQNEAAQMNRATEELMRSHSVSDEEVGYKYRCQQG